MNGLGIKQFVGHPLKNTPTVLRYTCRQEPGSLTTEYTVRDSKRRSGSNDDQRLNIRRLQSEGWRETTWVYPGIYDWTNSVFCITSQVDIKRRSSVLASEHSGELRQDRFCFESGTELTTTKLNVPTVALTQRQINYQRTPFPNSTNLPPQTENMWNVTETSVSARRKTLRAQV